MTAQALIFLRAWAGHWLGTKLILSQRLKCGIINLPLNNCKVKLRNCDQWDDLIEPCESLDMSIMDHTWSMSTDACTWWVIIPCVDHISHSVTDTKRCQVGWRCWSCHAGYLFCGGCVVQVGHIHCMPFNLSLYILGYIYQSWWQGSRFWKSGAIWACGVYSFLLAGESNWMFTTFPFKARTWWWFLFAELVLGGKSWLWW